jgi:gliding motility-associated-like protein
VIGKSSLDIPNVFTPDGTGPVENEAFKIIAPNMKTVHMTIFNRWGTKMYDEDSPVWDGTTPSGQPASSGTYYYIITATGLDGQEYGPKTGFVQLVR